MTTFESTTALEGLMMRTPLLVRSIAERAEQLFGDREVVSLTATGVERSSYGEVVRRARRTRGVCDVRGVSGLRQESLLAAQPDRLASPKGGMIRSIAVCPTWAYG